MAKKILSIATFMYVHTYVYDVYVCYIDGGVCKLSLPRPVTSLFSFELQAESHRIALSCVALYFFSFIGTWHVSVCIICVCL